MKKIITISVYILLAITTYSQNYCTDFEWVKKSGGEIHDYSLDIATDYNGNSYITGFFANETAFDTITLMGTQESNDIFIAKLDNSGNYLWATQAGGAGDDRAFSIAIDSFGDTYISGHFSDKAVFGSTVLISEGSNDIFIAKLDNNGDFLWSTQAGGIGNDVAYDIAVDSHGNAYITGAFSGTAIFGSVTLTTSGIYETFIAKLDNAGNFLWAKQTVSTISGVGNSIAIDLSDNVYITGAFSDTINFDNITLINTSAKDRNNAFVCKTDNSGNFLWVKQVYGNNSEAYGITVDIDGNAYITGAFSDVAIFDFTSLTSLIGTQIFIAKLDNAGNYLWVKQSGDGSSENYSKDIIVDISGNTYITGYFYGSSIFDSTTLTSEGIVDIFISKLDDSGNFLWAKKAGGAFDDSGYGISLDGSGNIYVTGAFSFTATFDNITFIDEGSSCIFITKINEEFASAEITSSLGTVLCPNLPDQEVTLEAVPNMDSYYWNNGEETQSISVNSPGIYICTATKNGCTHTDSIYVTVSTGQALVDFTYQVNGMDVQFNTVAPSINLISWDFGDGNTGIDANPFHTYASSGMYNVVLTITDFCGDTATKLKQINVVGGVGLEEIEQGLSIGLFPNPSTSELNFAFDVNTSNLSIEIFDISGRHIRSYKFNNLESGLQYRTIDISQFTNGLYLCKFSVGDKYITRRFIKN